MVGGLDRMGPQAGRQADRASTYGLLGFVWFNATNKNGQPFGISTPAAVAAFRKGASTYTRPGG
jgi:hypothetical protein